MIRNGAAGNRCRYTGVAEIEQKSTMVEYEADLSDASGKKMKRAKESSGSTKGKLTVTFDVYETNMTGCQTDTVAWAINVSECVSGDLESTGDVDGESTADDTEQVECAAPGLLLLRRLTSALGVSPCMPAVYLTLEHVLGRCPTTARRII